jgi:hypothetical protein
MIPLLFLAASLDAFVYFYGVLVDDEKKIGGIIGLIRSWFKIVEEEHFLYELRPWIITSIPLSFERLEEEAEVWSP